jgi:hypothetical protein
MYKNKYTKYKNKYLKLKHFGGSKEENNEFLLHGTNLFYIDFIKRDGLSGKFFDYFYEIMEMYYPLIKEWHITKYKRIEPYVDYFLTRQRQIRAGQKPYISFSGKFFTASEYGSRGSRKLGEGVGYFFNYLKLFIENNKYVDLELRNFYEILENAYRMPGIILAINKNDIEQLKDYSIDELNNDEYYINEPITPDKLYIRIDFNNYVKLLSDEGEEYINNLKLKHRDDEDERVKREKQLREEQLRQEEKMDDSIKYTINRYGGILIIEKSVNNNEIYRLTIDIDYDSIYFKTRIFNIDESMELVFSTGERGSRNDIDKLLTLSESNKLIFKDLANRMKDEMKTSINTKIQNALFILDKLILMI